MLSVLTCKASVYNWYRRGSVPEDSALRSLIVSHYGEADQRRFQGTTTMETYQRKDPWRCRWYVPRNVGSSYKQSQNASIIDIAVKASQKLVFFDNQYPTVDRLIDSDSKVAILESYHPKESWRWRRYVLLNVG
jgi:hypothetical protein